MSNTITIVAPNVNHLGPNDTVASAYREGAHRLRHGYPIGGSNLSLSVAFAMECIADALERAEPTDG